MISKPDNAETRLTRVSWLSHDPRSFIGEGAVVALDRRVRDTGLPRGLAEGRRASDLPADVNEAVMNLDQNGIDALLKPQKVNLLGESSPKPSSPESSPARRARPWRRRSPSLSGCFRRSTPRSSLSSWRWSTRLLRRPAARPSGRVLLKSVASDIAGAGGLMGLADVAHVSAQLAQLCDQMSDAEWSWDAVATLAQTLTLLTKSHDRLTDADRTPLVEQPTTVRATLKTRTELSTVSA